MFRRKGFEAMNKFEWFLLGCTVALPAYQYGKGKGLDWARKMYGK